MQLRRLLRRILEWLGSECDPLEGRHLWQDLMGFTELLSHISLREEVVDHDRRLIGQTFTYLFPPVGKKQAELDPELLAELEALLGLDDELDALIFEQRIRPLEPWREPLQRLRSRLGLQLR